MTTFAEIGIRGDILKGLDALGFEAPTAVQEEIIPIVLNRQVDLVGLAQTGTGKTAAFGIPLVQLCDARRKQTQALVLCPTRELCVQVARDMAGFGKFVPGLRVAAVYGGASIEYQTKSLRQGAQIVVATPGRLHDLIRRRKVDISAIRLVVLDEADEMLQMGFQDELNAILAETPDTKNTLLFSATMPKGVAAIAGNYMTDPMEITIGQRNAGAENVRHLYYMVQASDRYTALRRIVDMEPDMYSIVFCRTRLETKEVADKLMRDGISTDALHGELSQSQRDHVMQKFRRKNLQMLVATDVAARGLDVNDLTHVINYNLPDEIANYTHRSGRTGRAGKAGISIAIIHMRERHKIREIEKRLQRKFEQGRIPSGQEICEKQLLNHIDAIKKIDVDHDRLDSFLPAIVESLASLDREELIKRFVSAEFNNFLKYYRDARDLNVVEERKAYKKAGNGKNGKSLTRFSRHKFTRFSINVGKNDGLKPNRLIGQINDATGFANIKIGKIEIMNKSATLEADSKFAHKILNAFQFLLINGKPVSIKVVGDSAPGWRAEKGSKGRKPGKNAKTYSRKKAKEGLFSK